MGIDPAIIAIGSLAGAAIFGASAAMKFAAADDFLAAVENYRVIPRWAAKPAARMIPPMEAAGAAALLWPESREAGAALLIALLAAFSAAIAINLARGRREIDCGCFGPLLRQRISGWLLARNLALAMMLALALAAPDGRPLGALDYATIAGAAASTALLYAAANYILASAPATAALRTRDA
jgi:hypothetical protein